MSKDKGEDIPDKVSAQAIPLSGSYDGLPDKLLMRVPTRRDIKNARRAYPDDDEEAQDLTIADLCGITFEQVEALELADYTACVEALDGFTKKP